MPYSKTENPNHPVKGSQIKVKPIRSTKAIKRIKKILSDNSRNLCLFTLGINTAFRAGDLLKIKVSQVKKLKAGDDLEVKEEKTGKLRRVTLNKSCVDTIQVLLNSKDFSNDDYLFIGQRGRLTVSTVNNLVKNWCRDEKLEGNFGSHTLRKTFGYHQRITFNTPIPLLMKAFGHSTQNQTMEYLCIQSEEIKSIYLNEI